MGNRESLRYAISGLGWGPLFDAMFQLVMPAKMMTRKCVDVLYSDRIRQENYITMSLPLHTQSNH